MNWILIGIIFFAMWGILFLIIRAAMKYAQKLKEKKLKPDPIVKMKTISPK